LLVRLENKIFLFFFDFDFRRRRRSTNDLEPFTLEFNKQASKAQKVLDDDEENRTASEALFRSLPELGYRYYVINAACLFFVILVIQALILEKYRKSKILFIKYIFNYYRNALYLILVITGLCVFSIAALFCVIDLSKVSLLIFSEDFLLNVFILVTTR
jgi:hypothetical protein